jgi:hypothetical protein
MPPSLAVLLLPCHSDLGQSLPEDKMFCSFSFGYQWTVLLFLDWVFQPMVWIMKVCERPL